MIEEMADLLADFASAGGFTPSAQGSSASSVRKMTLGEVGRALQDAAATESEAINGNTVLSKSSKSETTFFDIYAIMALLQEVGQQERAVARDLRTAELNTEVASIHRQANKQREAGILGAIVSGITMVAQVALTAFSVTQSVKSLKSAYNTGAALDANVADTKFGTMNAQAEGPKATEANLESIKSGASPEAQSQVEQAKTDAGVPAAEKEYKAAMSDEKQASAELNKAKASNEAKIKELDTKIANKDGDVEAMKKEKAACEENIKTIDKGLKDISDTTKVAGSKYTSALEKAQAKLDASYQSASRETAIAEHDNIQTPSKDAAAKATACQQKQKTAGSASKLIDAELAHAKAEMGIKPDDQTKVKTQINATDADNAMTKNPAYSKAMNPGWNGLFQSLPEMVGRFGQSCATLASDLTNAEATEEQSNQKIAEAHREETNSLFSQAQDLITAARDCYKAIIQAESQSIEQIIRA